MHSRSVLLSTTLILIGLPFLSRKQSPEIPRHDVEIHGYRFCDALPEVAKTFHIVVGLEGILESDKPKLIRLSLKNVSVSEALDALVRADDRYEWKMKADGAIGVRLVRPFASPGDVVVHSFDVNNLLRRDISAMLDNQPELNNWFAEHSCRRVEVIQGHEWDYDTQPISIHTFDKTLRENLDAVALATQSYSWNITEVDNDGSCTFSIKM